MQIPGTTFSVIIPAFNNEDTIERAVGSVLGQGHSQFELIVVDDGSTDQGIAKVKRLGDPRIKVIRQENGGVSSARNLGIAEAKNEWIAFLDGDDEWDPGYLEKISELVTVCQDCIGAATSYYLGDVTGNRRKITLNAVRQGSANAVLDNYFEVASRSDPPVCSSAVCIRKSALLNLGGFPAGVKSGEDLLTWARLAATGNFAYCPQPFATFWQEQAHTYEAPPSRIPDPDDVVGKELENLYRGYNGPQKRWLKKYTGLWHKMRASNYLRLGMDRLAVKEILLSAKYSFINQKTLAYLVVLLLPQRLRNAVFRRFAG